MLKLNLEKYKELNIYYYEKEFLDLALKVIDSDYSTYQILKNTKRNYVSIIEVNNKKYVYKEPRNEFRIPQRQVTTLFKKGESLTTLVNINNLINMGFKEFVKPLVAANKRKYGFIVSSFFIMEYVEGEDNRENLDMIVEKMQKIHSKGYYHGDFNPGNFLVENKQIHILDTQGKKMFFGNYRAHYDMITMKYDSYEEMTYPYKKNLFYYLAYSMKRFKRLTFIEKIKYFKKKLRDKGWKI